MQWEIVVGLETHVQLLTRSKIFSGASTAFGAAPNTQACAVDIALPGVLPVLNKAAVEKAIRFGLAVGAKINRRSVFARKNYFYPDLPKGYQISQYEIPIVQGGQLQIVVGDVEKTVRLTRAHLEEDAGKSLHENFRDSTGIDLNRAGTPLLEIVSEPDMRSANEAVAYVQKLHKLVVDYEISDGNMQEGSFRFDANVSVRRPGEALGTRCEIKNLNSFRFLEHSIEFEANRQIEILEHGGAIEQETRLYDPDQNETRPMRTKEEAHDYRYFPDPDLLPLEISEKWIEEIRAKRPKSHEQRQAEIKQRFPEIPEYQVIQHAATPCSTVFATTTFAIVPPKERPFVSNLILGPLRALGQPESLDDHQRDTLSRQLKELSMLVSDGTISNSTATGRVLPALWNREGSVNEIIEKLDLKQLSDAVEIEKKIDEVLAANPKQVEDYRAGKQKAFNSLVGQVMKATQGRANPQQLNEILKRKLGG
ncbi:MAG TPA: Asp-tRNA(Asn)/Glu-tRNA(Gln) amidotransferase subunit GatB [Burkholderiales bacterium]|nr:Asp-tRNA(Asn)/Glu-tRNA(Gln) amidotransferase subunit GatB [Burkholderiales bacterium]